MLNISLLFIPLLTLAVAITPACIREQKGRLSLFKRGQAIGLKEARYRIEELLII